MKKIGIYFMMLALVAMTFVACNKDEMGSATITAVSEYEIPEDLASINIPVQIITQETDAKLESVVFEVVTEQDGQENIKELKKLTSFATNNSYVGAIVNAEPAVASDALIYLNYNSDMTKIIITVQVKDGDKSSKTITLKTADPVEPPVETDLSDPAAFTWKRSGSTNSGMAPFGLAFKGNVDRAWYARIVKDGADKFVELSAAKWAEITTQEQLEKAVAEATDITGDDGRMIPMTNNPDLNIVLATKYGEKYFIMHLETFHTEFTTETVNTITGQYKE